MGYRISAVYREIECFASLEFEYPMSTFFSVVKWSRFQRIGYVLSAYWEAVGLVRGMESLVVDGRSTVIEALQNYPTGLTKRQIAELVLMGTFEAQFTYVWELLSESEKEDELTANSDHWDNLWPFFKRLDETLPLEII